MARYFFLTLFSLFPLLFNRPEAIAATIMNKTKLHTTEGGSAYCTGLIGVVGTIKPGDTTKLDQLIKELKSKCIGLGLIAVMFHSEGGDVDEAIKMGRLIRGNELSTSVDPVYNCFSACVLAFAGGVHRSPSGKIGIHRPYFAALESNLSIKIIKEKRDQMSLLIRSYLKEMDINETLVEAMIAIPPEDMKILSNDELVNFRLVGFDPSYDEKIMADRAKQYGITSAIMRKRMINAEKCGWDLDCLEAASWGLSLALYNSRLKSVAKLCGNESSWDEFKSCQIAVMTGKK